MTTTEKELQFAKFKAAQDELKTILQRVPQSWSTWSYQKTHGYKKVVKECDKFINLKVSDDQTAFIKMENQLQKIKIYYR